MPDDANRPEKEESSPGLDLSGLSDLSLGPKWGSGNTPASKTPRSRTRDRDDRPPRDGRPSDRGAQRDRRGDRTARPRSDRPARGREAGRPRRSADARSEAPFKPLLEADFYPDDAPFKALTQAIKTSSRTFELFEIAQLILEKPERWVCVARHPDQKEGADAILQAAVPDGLPFLEEQAALNHVFAHHLGDFFEVESYEAEPPKGTFQLIHRCGVTGELLAPPNYHRYQAIIRDHHASRLSRMPFERFQEKLETVRDEESIQAWLEKMKQRERYTLKAGFVPEGTEAPVFEQIEDARLHLIGNHKDKLVRPAYSVRFAGKDLEKLPRGDILRRSIEALHAQQMRFPLATANNLRGRLRRLNFAVYKKGSKGVSFVCAVKRRFRAPDEVLAENLADLIAFIEANPNLKAPDLPREYLGLTAPAEEAPQPAAAPEAGSLPETAEAGTPEAAGETPETPAEPVAPSPQLSAEQEQVLALRRDLRYLVTQGYLIEYSDGRLVAPPVRDASGQVVKQQQENRPPVEKKDQPADTAATQPPEPEPEAEPEAVRPAEPQPASPADEPQPELLETDPEANRREP